MCSGGPLTTLAIGSSLNKSLGSIKQSRWEQDQAYDNAMRTNQSILDSYKWDSTQLASQKATSDKQFSQVKQDAYIDALKASDTARVYSTTMGAGGAAKDKIQQSITRQGANAAGRLNQQQELADLQFNTQLTSLRDRAFNQMQSIDFYRPNPLLMWTGVGLNAGGAGIRAKYLTDEG